MFRTLPETFQDFPSNFPRLPKQFPKASLQFPRPSLTSLQLPKNPKTREPENPKTQSNLTRALHRDDPTQPCLPMWSGPTSKYFPILIVLVVLFAVPRLVVSLNHLSFFLIPPIYPPSTLFPYTLLFSI